jgi:hypothetical protein
MTRNARWAVALAALMVPFTVTHAFEDFAYGIPARLGVQPLPAAFLLSLVYTVHLLAAVGTARGFRPAMAIGAVLGFGWSAAAALDHGREILFADPYRAGLVSKALEAGIIVVGAAWGITSVIALRRSAR